MALSNQHDPVEVMRAHVRTHVKDFTGLDESSGIELFSLMRMLMNLCEAAETQEAGQHALSGPRWAVLLRLMYEEERGSHAGLTPTGLSQFQRVSKNTISALLRGLEEQGLVERALDPTDHRRFRMLLTPRGRALVKATAPDRFRHLNRMVSGLSPAEREQLMTLLSKLYRSLLAALNIAPTPFHGG